MNLSIEQQQLLLKENKTLRLQLRQAYIKIKALEEHIASLESRLCIYENQETTIFEDDNIESDEEVFTQSSHSSQNQGNFENEEDEVVGQVIREEQLSNKSPRVIFNYNCDGKEPPQILQAKLSNRQISETAPQKRPSFVKSQVHSQKIIKFNREEIPKPKGLFQKLKSSKKVFETFFVTGYSQNLQPEIQYFYPNSSMHFPALLSLMYNQNSLRFYENSIQISKSPRFAKKIGKYIAKETFVIPLRKGDNQQKEYLVACEVEDFIQGPDHSLYSYSRMFCFITICNFFGAFKQILQQFIQKINSQKNKFMTLSPLISKNAHEQLQKLLQEHLQILWVQSIQENQYANFGLGSQIKVFIDIPSAENSYKTLNDFNSNDIFALTISVEHDGKFQRSELLGFLVIYLLVETKILLYSASKSKISEAVLHLAEFIKPLEYVNPIIIAAIKEDLQQYLDAPMPLVLGFWSENKSKKKQKIEIFVNRKACLGGAIQDCSLQVPDGVVVNLDTGRIFGGGLTKEKNQLSMQLNSIVSTTCKNFDDKYKLFDKIFRQNQFDGPDSKFFKSRLISFISNSQLFSFFKQKTKKIYQ